MINFLKRLLRAYSNPLFCGETADPSHSDGTKGNPRADWLALHPNAQLTTVYQSDKGKHFISYIDQRSGDSALFVTDDVGNVTDVQVRDD